MGRRTDNIYERNRFKSSSAFPQEGQTNTTYSYRLMYTVQELIRTIRPGMALTVASARSDTDFGGTQVTLSHHESALTGTQNRLEQSCHFYIIVARDSG